MIERKFFVYRFIDCDLFTGRQKEGGEETGGDKERSLKKCDARSSHSQTLPQHLRRRIRRQTYSRR